MFLTNKLRSGYSTGAELKTAYENELDTNAFTDSEKSKVAEAMTESNYALSIGRINNPLLHLPLKNSLDMICGAGSVTFTRSTTATYIDRYGVVQDAAINEARFEKEGLLIEGASTNKCLQSEDLSTTWTMANGSIGGSVTTPDGTTNTKCGIIGNAVDTSHVVYQYIASTAKTFSLSVFVKPGDKDWCVLSLQYRDSTPTTIGYSQCYFNVSTGSIGSTNNSNATQTSKITELANGWYKCEITGTYTGGETIASIQLAGYAAITNGDVSFVGDGSTVNTYFWGAQLEEMPFATSYIPTTTAAVTRVSEGCFVVIAENIPNTNENVSILADFDLLSAVTHTGNRYVFFIDGVNIKSFIATNNNMYCVYNNIAQSLGLLPDTKIRIGLILDNGTLKGYSEGELKTTGVPAKITVDYNTYIYIGGYSTFGHISNFRIYDVALTEAEMKIS